jgi:hypothetical protein
VSTKPHRPDDGRSKDLWNVGKLLPDYTALQPRRQPSSSKYCIRKGQTKQNVIFYGNLSFVFLVHAFSVFVTLSTTGHEEVKCGPLRACLSALSTPIAAWDPLSELSVCGVLWTTALGQYAASFMMDTKCRLCCIIWSGIQIITCEIITWLKNYRVFYADKCMLGIW